MSREREEELRARARKKSRAKKAAKRRRKKFILMFSVEAILLMVVLLCVFVLGKFDQIQKPDFKKEDIETNSLAAEVEEKLEGYTTYALFGVDARDNKTLDKGTHGDVVMIASINNATKEVRLASIYRDTYLCISKDGKKYGKMTTSYYNGGAQNAIETLNKNFDLQITDYVTFNWAAVATAINDLGGVTVDVPESMFKDNMINGYITFTVDATGIGSHHLKGPGEQLLDGIQAVSYCRIRYISGNDYGRTERQREVVEKMLQKAKSADVGTLNSIVNHVFPQIATNLELPTIISLAADAGKFSMGATAGFPTDENRGNATINKGAMVVPATLEETAKELHMFLYDNADYEPSSTVKAISKVIESDSGVH
ncbi:LCP family protein [Lachnotalea sp. AF33-28]|uniref:LCP family protein n=1 Tax=Lachnotalea sp. AF33-28 TaxID=2292046 RepID=UPI000E49601C|nr:LCP family protein [Lachnotalea sp. AF33-28]RHP32435.1 LytR family transcriptional regulator [Lachnotalea sp. AF33-28]